MQSEDFNDKVKITKGYNMTAELTTEQIVTRLLSTEEILKPQKEKFCTSTVSLGDFLTKFPNEKLKSIPEKKETKYMKFKIEPNT